MPNLAGCRFRDDHVKNVAFPALYARESQSHRGNFLFDIGFAMRAGKDQVIDSLT